ncbi:MAG TPA: phosphate ABC transporter permease subunit PstC [Patescibacteria group bacterium]|nr:phosphate ABC transporter permease subunit PstC [Patescibacteria group bacterium]
MIRRLKDRLAGAGMLIVTLCSGLIVFLMILGLYVSSRSVLSLKPLSELLFSSEWHPLRGEFGLLPFIMGTLWVTAVAAAVAIPLCLLASIYLSEYAHRRLRALAAPLIDLLAGIPSVVYGVWAVLILVPLIKNHIAPFFGVSSSGYSVLAGGVVLAVMIFPIIIHVTIEVLRSVPQEMREVSLALGATCWQTIRLVVLRKAMPGVLAAIVLGLSRAFGETMAVLMVVGNVAMIPSSVFDPAYPLPALIANKYGEMLSVPLYDSALLLAALVLMLAVLAVNVAARVFLVRVERGIR